MYSKKFLSLNINKNAVPSIMHVDVQEYYHECCICHGVFKGDDMYQSDNLINWICIGCFKGHPLS